MADNTPIFLVHHMLYFLKWSPSQCSSYYLDRLLELFYLSITASVFLHFFLGTFFFTAFLLWLRSFCTLIPKCAKVKGLKVCPAIRLKSYPVIFMRLSRAGTSSSLILQGEEGVKLPIFSVGSDTNVLLLENDVDLSEAAKGVEWQITHPFSWPATCSIFSSDPLRSVLPTILDRLLELFYLSIMASVFYTFSWVLSFYSFSFMT